MLMIIATDKFIGGENDRRSREGNSIVEEVVA